MRVQSTLHIDKEILIQIKHYAKQKGVSVSYLVEEYFKTLIDRPKFKNILDLIEKLPSPKNELNGDLKTKFYHERSSKYGF